MAERKTLTITEVKEIVRFGADNQGQKLPFRAKDGDTELDYFTFKRNLFDKIKQGETITADIETEQRGEYTNRKITQLYQDGQPVIGKGTGGYRGKSPEELEQQARLMILAYAKDLAVADKITLDDIPKTAERFYTWLKVGDKIVAPLVTAQTKTDEPTATTPTGKKVQNTAELKKLLMKHKIETHEAYEILSIGSFMDLVDLDKAWADIKKAKGIEH